MKSIKMIDRFRAQYERYHIGQQVEIEETPFTIRNGILTKTGEIENADPASIMQHNQRFTLAPATNGQVVGRIVNKGHRKMFLYIKSTVGVVSYDWLIKVAFTNPVTASERVRPLGNGKGGQLYFDDVISSSGAVMEILSDIPYGDNISIVLSMDNNHVATDIPIDSSFVLFDPVR